MLPRFIKRGFFGLTTVLCAISATSVAQDSSPYEVKMLTRAFVPDPSLGVAARTSFEAAIQQATNNDNDTIHALVQFQQIPTDDEKTQLAAAGFNLGAYVPGRAFITALPASQALQLMANPAVRTAFPWGPEQKVHPRLRASDVGDWALNAAQPEWMGLFVILHHDVDLSRFESLAEELEAVVFPPVSGVHGATFWIQQDKLETLAAVEDVLWIEEAAMPLEPTNDGVRSEMRVNPLFDPPYNLNGNGVNLFVFDGGAALDTHETFITNQGQSRVERIDDAEAKDHSTHVAGTAAGDGAPTSGGHGRGVARRASILSAGFDSLDNGKFFWDNSGDIEIDYATARNRYGADLATNSLGTNIAAGTGSCNRNGDYGVTSSLLDAIVRGDDDAISDSMIIMWAASNERDNKDNGGRCGANYRTISPPACAKNPIHVGAVNSDGGSMTLFSSWGPCDDGRLKPTVTAPGCETGFVSGETGIFSALANDDTRSDLDNTRYGLMCGTSMATPGVAGVTALFIQQWRKLGYGDRPQTPALIKAMMIHTARDLGLDGPDYTYGYGHVDASALIDLLTYGDFGLGGPSTNRFGNTHISQGQNREYFIDVAPLSKELKASLAWDDPAAAAFSAVAGVNDLDLELVDPEGNIHSAWVLDPLIPWRKADRGTNTRDNEEQVRVDDPMPGRWVVRIKGNSVPNGPQVFGLALSVSPAAQQPEFCTVTVFDFEEGSEGFILNGATISAAPAPGHGALSLKMGGQPSTISTAVRQLQLGAGVKSITLSLFGYMSTQRNSLPYNDDIFVVQIQDANTFATLKVVDYRTDGWMRNRWIGNDHMDLTEFAGQDIQLRFFVGNDATAATTFWVDDMKLRTCRE